MDLPLTNDLIAGSQKPQNSSSCHPFWLFLCVVATSTAGLLLLDHALKDQRESSSGLIVLQDEFFPEERVFFYSSEKPLKTVVPEFTVALEEAAEPVAPDDPAERLNGSPESAASVTENEAVPENREDVWSDADEVPSKGMGLKIKGFETPVEMAGLGRGEAVGPLDNTDGEVGEPFVAEGLGMPLDGTGRKAMGPWVTASEPSGVGLDVSVDIGYVASVGNVIERPEGDVESNAGSTLVAGGFWVSTDEEDSRAGAARSSVGLRSEESSAWENANWQSGLVGVPGVYFGIESEDLDEDATGNGLFDDEEQTCYDFAKSISEPYSQDYATHMAPVDITGPVWADYYWPGIISKEDVSRAKSVGDYKSFKILGKKLYASLTNHIGVSEEESNKINAFVNAALLAMALYDIPDVDFIVDFGEHQSIPTSPALHFAFDKSLGNPMGFTVPDRAAVEDALGPSQIKALYDCLEELYPAEGRSRAAVVYGTGSSEYAAHLNEAANSSIAALSYRICSQTDCGLVSSEPGAMGFTHPAPGRPSMTVEDLNQFAFVVDTDEAGQSSGFARLLMQNTPVLKKDTQFPRYFWPHIVEDRPVHLFRSEGPDFVETFETAAKLRDENPGFFHHVETEKMRAFSATHLSHVGVARATAYALTVYASKMDWLPIYEQGFVGIPPEALQMDTLPEAFKFLRIIT